jgi:hypothetical protein
MRFNAFIDSLSIKSGMVATLAIFALGGCIGTTYPYMRTETAQRIAAPAWMIKRDINASPFLIRAYERIHDRGGVATVYIEGEESETQSEATPLNPVALHLASKDKAENVIYLARPCQYTGMLSPAEKCDQKYWKEGRLSEEVIQSIDTALDEISKRYSITSFDLVGYSSGGAIASLIAARRDDITSLRTVAGILDHEVYSNEIQIEPLNESLNPVSQAPALANMPQYHFIGGRDNVVPPAVLHSYLQAMPPSKCVQTMLLQEASHDDGWVDKWPELLELPVTCYAREPDTLEENLPVTANTLMPPTMPQDIHHISREKPVKP